MFDGRHSTKRDLDLLVEETRKIKSYIEKNTEISQKNEELQRFLAFIRRFDEQIAGQLEFHINHSGGDCERIINAINKYTNELMTNVQVDIYEHQ